ncbi:MAG: hypothetical protein ABUS56_02485 [Acidobacteriota bacterium]
MDVADYCREVESFLCRKNDGHVIRLVGPSFDLVAGWATGGVPIKVALRGIDRYFERYYAKGPRRRPVRIDFCNADVLDVFDEWRRATGVTTSVTTDVAAGGTRAGADEPAGERAEPVRHGPSLPAHLERVLRRLTSARVAGALDAATDDVLDRVSAELDLARRGVRGEARRALLDRLAELDRALLAATRARLDAAAEAELAREAEEELAGFRAAMTDEVFARARDAALDRLVRERANLPVIALL